MNENKHYYAFISHSSKDEKIALWLRDQLVSYNIPISVQKQYNVPKRLCPVFVYQTDLAGNVLNEALGRELRDSQYLIVICSPSGAKSEYVNNEVQQFIDAGRADKIIPFIIEGVPHAKKTEEECFAPAMLNAPLELRGTNLKDLTKKLGSKKSAVLNVIASMLGVRFDVLWDMYKLKHRRKQILYAVLAGLMAGMTLFIWDYKRSSYRYFVDYVDCWGAPEGIVELNKEQLPQRGHVYQFKYHRVPFGEPNAYSWRVVEVALKSNKSIVCPDALELKHSYSIQEIQYYPNTGDVQQLRYYDSKGKLKLRHELSERKGIAASVADFRNATQNFGIGHVVSSPSVFSMEETSEEELNSSIIRYSYERDNNGHIVKITFHSSNIDNLYQSIVCDANGVYGCQFVLDSLGRRIKMEYLGKDGELITDKKGIAGREIEYDEYGNIARVTFLNIKNEPVLNEKLWASCRQVFLKGTGLVKEIAYYGIDGNLCINSDNYAVVNYNYCDRTEVTYFGTNGWPCLNKNGTHKEIWVEQTTNIGRVVEVTYYDLDEKPLLCDGGYHKEVTLFDKKSGSVIENTYFGTDLLPIAFDSGYAKRKIKYDGLGNLCEFAYFGVDGEPCEDKEGVSKCVCVYDEFGNVVEIAWFDEKGVLTVPKNGICAKRLFKYDDKGIHVIEETFFGVDGNPCLVEERYAKIIIEYDNKGDIARRLYFDINGNQIQLLLAWEVADVEGRAKELGIDIKSIVLQYNDWVIGQDEESFFETFEKSFFTEKDLLLITPNNEINHFYVDKGLSGIDFTAISIMKSQADEWKTLLDEWKRINE